MHNGGQAQWLLFPLVDRDWLPELARDALMLELVRVCVDGGVPLLGLCRGFQKINIACGESCRLRRQHRLDPQGAKGRSDPWRT